MNDETSLDSAVDASLDDAAVDAPLDDAAVDAPLDDAAVDAPLDSAVNAPLDSAVKKDSNGVLPDYNNNGSRTANAEDPAPKLSLNEMELFRSALADISKGRFGLQDKGGNDPDVTRTKELTDHAVQLQRRLEAEAKEAKMWPDVTRVVDEYFALQGLTNEGETLAAKRIKVDFRSTSGTTHSLADFNLGSRFSTVRAAIDSSVGSNGVARQLLCAGKPVTDDAQSLYRLANDSNGAALRNGKICLQEVARTTSG